MAYKPSPQQRLAWQVGKRGAPGRLRGVALIDGVLDPERLQEAVRAVVGRYEILRTQLKSRSGVLSQIVGDRVEFEWRATSDGRATSDEGVVGEEVPVIAFSLTPEGARNHRLTIDVAASSADYASLELLFREIAGRYAGTAGDEAPLQYADLSAWLNETAAASGEGKDFWSRVLDESRDEITLPGENAPAGDSQSFAVKQRVAAEGAFVARRVARTFDTTAEAVLFACWQAVLGRWTDAKRLPVAFCVAGRNYEHLASAVGPLERQVPVVRKFEADDTVETLLSDARKILEQCADWQEYFSWELAESLGSGSLKFAFSHQELPMAWSAGSLAWQIRSLDCPTQANTVTLRCISSGATLACELRYDASRLDEATAESLLRQFETMLSEVAAAPSGTKLSSLDIVGEEERAILESFHATAPVDASGPTVLALLDEQVARRGGNVALSSGDTEITYADLDARANRLAHHLVSLGAAPDQVVGVCLDRDSPLIVAMLAIWKANAAYLPLNDIPEARTAYMLADSSVRIVITESRHSARFQSAGVTLVTVDSEWQQIMSLPAVAPPSRVSTGNLAYVIYTSGSTGEPKGVMVEHRSLLNHMLWAVRELGLGERERMLMKTSISFDASVWEWQFPLLQGGTLVLLKEGMHRDAAALVRELRDRRVTTLQMVPTMLRVVLEEPAIEECRHLERVFVGGEAVDAALVQRVRERTGQSLINLYGPTEATIDATSLVMEPRYGSAIGRSIANTKVQVLRSDLSLAAVGEAGEICICGAALARGYIGRPEATAEKFVPDPRGKPGDRLYRTGDRGRYRADGILEYLGRDDGQIKIRGHRIEIGEIERALLAQPGVVNAAVVVKSRSASEKQLLGYVELATPAAESAIEQVRAGIRERLPEYMCPAQVVRLDVFPRTAGGKIDRRALSELEPERVTSGAAPRNEAETKLVEIWSAALGGVPVGINDNFFELGGDSIIGIQIVARARKAGLPLTPLQLFQYQTIAELAEVAQSGTMSTHSEAAQDTELFPLTPIQHAFFEASGEDVNHYNQAFLFELPADIRVEVLEKALASVCRHHDALRLRFERTKDGWRQRYASADSDRWTLAQTDLTNSPNVEAALREAQARENAGLNISHGPLLKASVLNLGSGRGRRLLIVAHHLVVDGVSWRIFLEDLAASYQQIARGEQAQLPARTSSYRRWAEQLSKFARTERLQGELSYWLSEQKRQTDSFHADDPAGENTMRFERRQYGMLDEADTRKLLSVAGKAYRTQFMDLFLAALPEALYRWRGQTSTRIELEGHGREEVAPGVDLTRTVGWFTSLYPVVVERRGRESLADRIRRTKDQLRSVPNKGIGYGVLRYVGGASGLAGSSALTVNYLGQLDGAVGRTAWLPVAREACGDSASETRQRNNLLELNAMVVNGCLRMLWTYSERCYREETVAALARALESSLREVIAHCVAPNVGGVTSSDLADFNWGQSQLDKLAAAIAEG